MTILSSLYTIFIGPLELLYDVVYTLSYYLTNNPGISIIVLGLVINILLLPLYNRADAIQTEENEIEKKLKPGVDHIKKTFKGDEQYMVLQAYYRENNYKVLYSLRGLLPLLLEIPFFIAAYNYLSNLSVLAGASFGPINNLIKPDGLLNGINILPILMTIVNIISSIIYTKDSPLKSKIQLFGMALLFLVLLYNSPSGLVIYWTLNNLFSLVKNILVRLKNSKLIISIICSTISILGIIFILFIHPLSTLVQTIGVVFILLLLQIPLIVYLINRNKQIKDIANIKVDNKIYYLSTLFLCLFMGLLIPSQVVSSAPQDFVTPLSFKNPCDYLIYTFLLAIGVFIIWCNIYYFLLKDKIKYIINLLFFALCGVVVIDYLVFGKNMGSLSNKLIFDQDPVFSMKDTIVNSLIIIFVFSLLVVLYKRIRNICKVLLMSGLITMIIIGLINYRLVNNRYYEIVKSYSNDNKRVSELPTINLSKDKENIVVIILDKAIGMYFPYLLEERPELINSFSGFTYYPNTVCFGPVTNIAIPSVYGGYEYTPDEINKRPKETMADKYNESIKVLPKLFSDNGYSVSMYDTAYAGFKEVPDMSIYDDIDGVKAYTLSGKYNIDNFDYDISEYSKIVNRKLFSYSIMKSSPLFLQSILYNTGAYLSIENYNMIWGVNFSKRDSDISTGFVSEYGTISNLSNITRFDENNNTFMMIYNYVTHDPVYLQMPNYTLTNEIDNVEFDKVNSIKKSIFGDEFKFSIAKQVRYYHTNMLTMIKIGEWLDFLKEHGAYDNTKIIIVSDHAEEFELFEKMYFENDIDLSKYIPLLLVKNTNSTEFSIDDSFMTNADVASIVTENSISKPINPYTGKIINSDYKKANDIMILQSDLHDIRENNGNTFIEDTWFTVHDNVYDMNNWKIVE